MGDKTYRLIEKYEADFDKIASKEVWEPKDICTMKDLQKLMYYIEVREAMKNGEEYPGSEYMDQGSFRDGYNMGHSYANRGQMRNPSNGQYMSRNMSGTYPMNDGPWYYDNGMSSRRYYDDGSDHALQKLHQMMETENDPRTKAAMQEVIRKLEMK